MKAYDLLKELHGISLFEGEAYINGGLKFTILQGSVLPKSEYFVTFKPLTKCEPDAIITYGTEDKQYFYKVQK